MLNSIEALVPQALIDMEISHEEFRIFEGERWIWENERKCGECAWKIRVKK